MNSAQGNLIAALSSIKRWSFQNKLTFFSTLIILAVIPITVFAAVSFRTLNSKATTVGSNTYGDCTVYGCTGPSLTGNWVPTTFQVRYKCCFSPNFTNWINVGSKTNYTGPYAIFDYEVQIFIGNQPYPWKTGNNNGSSTQIFWAAPLYRSQLVHDTEFINACYKGLGGNNGQLTNCLDHGRSNSTSFTYTGLSPNEFYDLYVNILDNQNSGTGHTHVIQDHIGPTGGCINCPVLPPPPPPPPTKPANLSPGIYPILSCIPSGGTWGGQLNFSWTGSGATQYAVDISSLNNFSGFTNKIVGGGTFNISGNGGWNNQYLSALGVNGNLVLQPNTTYYWRVWASNSSGAVYSDIQTVSVPTCAGTPPPAPTNLTGIPNALCYPAGSYWGGAAIFRWTGSGATSYYVDIADNSAFYPGFANKSMAADGTYKDYSLTGTGFWNNQVGTTYSLNGNLNLVPGKTYYFRVLGINSAGQTYSGIGSIYMPICGTSVGKAVITGNSDWLTCTSGSTWGITHAFSWTGGDGATDFWIDVSPDSSFNSFTNKHLSGNVFATNGQYGWNDRGTGLTLNGNLNLVTGRSYYFRVFAYNASGNVGVESDPSGPFTLGSCAPPTQPTPQNSSLPSPWQSYDIGNYGYPGGALFDGSINSGQYTVTGGGADIWGTADAFHYVSMDLIGNATMGVDVNNQTMTDGWAKAGLMIRTSRDANSAYAFIAITPSNGVAFQYRTAAGAYAQHTWNPSFDASRRPMRVVITRSGNTITGSAQNADGTLSTIGTVSISLPNQVLIGFAVTSHNYSAVSSVNFSRMTDSPFSDSRATTLPTNLRYSEKCSADGNSATATFQWNGPNDLGAYYLVELSFGQNQSTRWSSGIISNGLDTVPKNGNVYVWGNLPTNTVMSWRVYTPYIFGVRTYYSNPIVLCNTKPSGSPVSGYISSFFGPSHPPDGIDIAQDGIYPSNQVVYSTLKGVISAVGVDPNAAGYGNKVDIYQDNAIFDGSPHAVLVRYGHFSSIFYWTSVGRSVPWGFPLGVWGCTGTCTGTHVHYEIHVGAPGTPASVLGQSDGYNSADNPLNGNYNLQTYSCSVAGGSLCSSSAFAAF